MFTRFILVFVCSYNCFGHKGHIFISHREKALNEHNIPLYSVHVGYREYELLDSLIIYCLFYNHITAKFINMDILILNVFLY